MFNESGMVLTNAHVVVGHTDVVPRYVVGDEFSGKVIGINSPGYTNGNTFGFSIPFHSVVDTLNSWVR